MSICLLDQQNELWRVEANFFLLHTYYNAKKENYIAVGINSPTWHLDVANKKAGRFLFW